MAGMSGIRLLAGIDKELIKETLSAGWIPSGAALQQMVLRLRVLPAQHHRGDATDSRRDAMDQSLGLH